MPQLPLDPDECSWTDEGQDFIYHRKLRAAVYRGDYETCDELQDNYFDNECLSSSFTASIHEKAGAGPPQISRSKQMTVQKHYRISSSSAQFNLTNTIGHPFVLSSSASKPSICMARWRRPLAFFSAFIKRKNMS